MLLIAELVVGMVELVFELLPECLGAMLDGASSQGLSRNDWW